MKVKYVTYKRVSTTAQGISGLGLEAQAEAIRRFIDTNGGEIVADFIEIESGKRADRPQLMAAIALCQKHGYKLLVAKLDRLARNLHFITTLQQSKIEFIAIDNLHATPFVIHILCAVAEAEAVAISKRTREALEACKRRGVRLGNPNPAAAIRLAVKANQTQADKYSGRLLPVIKEIQTKAQVTSYTGIANVLNLRGLKTRTGKAFAAQSVKNVLQRAGN
jgi:DNA invertase Pin-like site-specific DNA recombinase